MEIIADIAELVSTKTKSIRVYFDQLQTSCHRKEAGIDLYLKVPSLGHLSTECIISQAGCLYQKLGFDIVETDDKIAGALVQEVSFPLAEATYEIYLNFLKLTENWNLFRIWNYIPHINEQTFALENYKSFCQGRSLAFEDFYGDKFNFKLPSASAVGIDDNKIVLYFIAGKERGIYVENPEQVSAFHYPRQYGPRPPSFARGTLTTNQKRIGYLSGTASIKGHRSVTLSSISDQLLTTIDNMNLVFAQMGLVSELRSCGITMPDPAKYHRTFKVYIRHLADAKSIQDLFSRSISSVAEDKIIYLQADLCRSELDVEIEAIIEEK